MNADIKSILDTVTNAARQNLIRDGHLVPVSFLVGKHGVKIVATPFPNDAAKEAIIPVLRKMARDHQAETVVHIAEVWVSTLKDAKSLDDWDGVQPSQSPDRTEAIVVYVESLDGYWLGTAPITRTDGRPTFGEVEYRPQGERDPRERFQRFL